MKMIAYMGLAIFAVGLAALMFQFAACRNPTWQDLCYLEDYIHED